jgi:competence protein ComEC
VSSLLIYGIFAGTIIGSIIFNFFEKIFSISFFLTIICIFAALISKNKLLTAAAIIFVSATITIWHGLSIFKESKIAQYTEQEISVIGKIVGEPDKRETNTRLTIFADFTEIDGQKIFTEEKLIATIANYPEYKTGQDVRITGKIKVPENFTNDVGIEFDYKKFLEKNRIYSLMYYPKIELLDSKSGFNFVRSIYKIKQLFLEKIGQIMPSPESELLGGILLGVKRSLGTELENNFRKVGLVHIIVLSGYNVTIIAEAILKFFGFLPKMFSIFFGGISILIFCIMVGSGATVVRSTIMTILALVARISGRTYSVNRALFFAAAMMIILNPMILFYDPSFQLSFLATLGLINLSGFVKKIFPFIPEKFNLREITTATFSTQITVLPLLMNMTGQLSVVAPIVNIITLQFIPLTMLLGFIAGLCAFINQSLGIFVGFVPYLLLKYILFIVNLFAKLKFATINL